MRNGFICLISVLVVCGSSRASIVDQAQEQTDGMVGFIYSSNSFAQTFTAGMTGQLDSIDLYLENLLNFTFPPDYPSIISIVSVNGAIPNGPVLGQVYEEHFITGFNNISFFAQSVFLNTGTQYGLVLSNNDTAPYDSISVNWDLKNSDVYGGGSLWNWQPGIGWNQNAAMPTYDFSKMDAVFKTYMVPEPRIFLLLGLGSLMLLKRK